MTKSLQELIDASIFISTEYQARLAELVGTAQLNIDFTHQSLSFETTPPVSFQPYLLGTESESRGTWVWSWQQLGYFPDAVVSAAIQARQAGSRNNIEQLRSDEVELTDSLARRLTLAAKTVTGLYAHYPLPAGAGVRAWTLLDGPELKLPEPTVQRVGKVIAQTLQSENIVNQILAVDSYAKQRGFHIAWDTEATAVLTLTDGALRLWFDEGIMSGIESAEPEVGADILERCQQQMAGARAQLATERINLEAIAAAEARQHRAKREAEKQRAEQEQAQAPAPEQVPAKASQGQQKREEIAGVMTTENLYPDKEAPFDQDPREDSEPGTVTTSTLPGIYANEDEELIVEVYDAESVEVVEVVPPANGTGTDAATEEPAPHPIRSDESVSAETFIPAPPAEEPVVREREEEEEAGEGKKKGFFSRFFGL